MTLARFFPEAGNWCALFHGISTVSALVPFALCQISFFHSGLYLRVFLQFPKSMSFSSMVYNIQLWFYQLPHQVLMLWFTFWLHSSLFLLPICRRSVHCLMHIKQPDANFCCLFLMSMFLSSWLTLLIRQCSKMETFGFCVISNW